MTNHYAKTLKLTDDLKVSRIGFGTIHLTVERGFGPARPNAIAVLHAAVRLGVNFFDTADSYGPGTAEDLIREALYPYKDIVIATKGGYEHTTLDAWQANGHPAYLRAALEGSLKRLGVDRIDLYQLHVPDPGVPYEESLGAVKEFCVEGKVRYAGVSRVNLAQLRRAQQILGKYLVAVQNCYNMFYQQGYRPETENEEVLSVCEQEGLAFISWAPLAAGDFQTSGLNTALLLQVARKHRVSPQRVMLVALLQRSDVILPIPGTCNLDHLKDNVASEELVLAQDELDDLWILPRPVGLVSMP